VVGLLVWEELPQAVSRRATAVVDIRAKPTARRLVIVTRAVPRLFAGGGTSRIFAPFTFQHQRVAKWDQFGKAPAEQARTIKAFLVGEKVCERCFMDRTGAWYCTG
jgi:hypothetical protein